MQNVKVLVAGNDAGSSCSYRQLQEHVVFGSRHTSIRSLGSTARAFEIMFSTNARRVSKDTYFSNLGRENTLKYSDAVSADTNSVPFSLAFF